MKRIASLFFKIDVFIFQKLSKFYNSEAMQKIFEKLNRLPPQNIQLIYNTIMLLVFIIPIGLLLLIFLNTYSTRKNLANKFRMVESFQKIEAQKNKITTLGKDFINYTGIEDRSQMETIVKQILKENNTDADRVKIASFSSEQLITVKRSVTSIDFTNLSLNDLSMLFDKLTTKHKMKIDGLILRKDDQTAGLTGSFNTLYFSKI